MITEDYVSFDIAKLLLEKGYPFNDCWHWCIDFDNISSPNDDDEGDGEVEINECHYPLISIGVAMKWLRLEHNLFVQPTVGETDGKTWYDFDIIPVNGKVIYWKSLEEQPQTIESSSPEEACATAIKYCLEKLI